MAALWCKQHPSLNLTSGCNGSKAAIPDALKTKKPAEYLLAFR